MQKNSTLSRLESLKNNSIDFVNEKFDSLTNYLSKKLPGKQKQKLTTYAIGLSLIPATFVGCGGGGVEHITSSNDNDNDSNINKGKLNVNASDDFGGAKAYTELYTGQSDILSISNSEGKSIAEITLNEKGDGTFEDLELGKTYYLEAAKDNDGDGKVDIRVGEHVEFTHNGQTNILDGNPDPKPTPGPTSTIPTEIPTPGPSPTPTLRPTLRPGETPVATATPPPYVPTETPTATKTPEIPTVDLQLESQNWVTGLKGSGDGLDILDNTLITTDNESSPDRITIKKINLTTGVVLQTIDDFGPNYTDTTFASVCFDNSGNIYALCGDGYIYKLNSNGSFNSRSPNNLPVGGSDMRIDRSNNIAYVALPGRGSIMPVNLNDLSQGTELALTQLIGLDSISIGSDGKIHSSCDNGINVVDPSDDGSINKIYGPSRAGAICVDDDKTYVFLPLQEIAVIHNPSDTVLDKENADRTAYLLKQEGTNKILGRKNTPGEISCYTAN